jgi:hypothetical protein
MKRIALSLLAVAGLTTGTLARADHVDVRGSINFGTPIYNEPRYAAPVYAPSAPVYVAPRGYWQETAVNVWIPSHWVARHDRFGRSINYWEPGHYEVQTQRVWIDADTRRSDRDRWEHERWEREHGRDWNR